MKKSLFLPLLLLLAFFSSFSQQKKWTLQECIAHALKNNITIKKQLNTIGINQQDIIASKGAFLPSLSGSASQSLSLGQSELFAGSFVNRTFHSTNIGLNVSQTVFNGFRNTNLYKQSLLNLETSTLELNRIKDAISLNVANAYLNVLFNKENLETSRTQFEFSKKQLAQVKNLVHSGVQPRANIYDAEATLSRDAQNLTIAENNLNLALVSLSQLLQVPYHGFNVEIIHFDSPSQALLYKDITPILNYALKNRNEIKIAQKNIENAALETQIAKSGFLPTVSLGYAFNSGANFSNLSNSNSFFQQINDNKGHSFNLRVGIPIFSRFQNKTAVAKSLIRQEHSKLDLQESKLNLESNIQSAFTEVQAALKTYQAAKKSVASQELAFSNSQERYSIGSITSFELEQWRVNLINAKSSLINAKYDFVFKTKILDFYMGKHYLIWP